MEYPIGTLIKADDGSYGIIIEHGKSRNFYGEMVKKYIIYWYYDTIGSYGHEAVYHDRLEDLLSGGNEDGLEWELLNKNV